MYRYTYRSYEYADGTGTLYNPGNGDARAYVVESFPWMAKPPYNMSANGTTPFPLTLFVDNGFSYGNFLNGSYAMGPGANLGLISQVIDTVVSFMRGKPGAVAADYSPDVYGSNANNYSGNEYESAGYIMATVNIGPQLTLIPGVRYQGLRTVYQSSFLSERKRGNLLSESVAAHRYDCVEVSCLLAPGCDCEIPAADVAQHSRRLHKYPQLSRLQRHCPEGRHFRD